MDPDGLCDLGRAVVAPSGAGASLQSVEHQLSGLGTAPAAYQQQLAVYHCPARPAFVLSVNDFSTAGGGLSDYGASFGTNNSGGGGGSNANGAIVPVADMNNAADTSTGKPMLKPNWRGQVSLVTIIDGTSNTLMFGEKARPPQLAAWPE